MKNSMRLSDYHYPYVILILKFLHHFEVNLEEELSKVVKSSHEVNNGSLSKMGFTKVGGKWVSKDCDQVGSSSKMLLLLVMMLDTMMKKAMLVLVVLMILIQVLETWENALHLCHHLRD